MGHFVGFMMNETDTEDEVLSSEEDEETEDFDYTSQSVVLFIDVDSFEVQVHGLNRGISPSVLSTQPFIVVNNFGVITAVNYPAKEKKITRSKECTLDVARRLCPNVQVLEIPTRYDKPNSLIAKRYSDNIFDAIKNALKKYCVLPVILEKSSKDEFFIDVSKEVFRIVHGEGKLVPNKTDINKLTSNEKFFVETPSRRVSKDTLNYRASKVLTDANIGLERHVTEAWLMHGASIVSKILEDVQKQTQFVCSAGVSSNKLLAKLGCSRYKPNAITVFPQTSVPRVSKTILLERLPGMGGKEGQLIKEKLNVDTMAKLGYVNRVRLMKVLGTKGGSNENYLNLNAIATGFDTTAVVSKSLSKSIQCGITFSHKTRKMKNRNDFMAHLENRFKEMREHLLYEYFRHKRIPSSFRLEVKTRKKNFKTVFGETVEISPNLKNRIKEETKQVNGNTISFPVNPLPLTHEWKLLCSNFVDKMGTDCKIKVVDQNPQEAEPAVRKVSEIKLLAEFPIIPE